MRDDRWTTAGAELSISDPWEVASCLASPLLGSVVQSARDSALIRLDEPVLVGGILARSALATPRHVGVGFERSARSVPANIVLSASDATALDCLDAARQAMARESCVAAVGAVSFGERNNRPD